MELTFKLIEINKVAEKCWPILSAASVVAFHGEMGAGKTTFIHALCDFKKVNDVVSSPTFSIINEYTYDENGIEHKIFHIDLYRLKNEQEALQAGVEDCFYSDHCCFVEWPEKIPSLLPDNTVHIYIKVIDAQTRKLEIGDK